MIHGYGNCADCNGDAPDDSAVIVLDETTVLPCACTRRAQAPSFSSGRGGFGLRDAGREREHR